MKFFRSAALLVAVFTLVACQASRLDPLGSTARVNPADVPARGPSRPLPAPLPPPLLHPLLPAAIGVALIIGGIAIASTGGNASASSTQ